MAKTGVIGAGSWGTALAHVLASAGREVALLLRDEAVAEAVNERHENPRYLAGLPLASSLRAVTDFSVLGESEVWVLAVPCQHQRAVLEAAREFLRPDTVLVNAAKGIELTTLKPLSVVVREALRGNTRVKGIYVVNVSTDAEEAKLAAERLVQEHPEINVLVGFNEPLAVGVAEAVDELGLTGQVRAISFDTNMRCIELMQTGAVGALIVQNPYAMGYLGVEKAWQALQGMKFDKHELIDTMTQIVTKENMFTLESQKALFSFS